MEPIRQVLAAMYLAGVYTAPDSLSRSNEFLSAIADDPGTSREAARMLRIMVAQSSSLLTNAPAHYDLRSLETAGAA
jgi:hypothetical protein